MRVLWDLAVEVRRTVPRGPLTEDQVLALTGQFKALKRGSTGRA
jgi:hypothetical protein